MAEGVEDGEETTDAVWITPIRALEEHRAGRFDLMSVTVKQLSAITEYKDFKALKMALSSVSLFERVVNVSAGPWFLDVFTSSSLLLITILGLDNTVLAALGLVEPEFSTVFNLLCSVVANSAVSQSSVSARSVMTASEDSTVSCVTH